MYSYILDIKTDVIRKRYNKWVQLGVFKNAYNAMLKININ